MALAVPLSRLTRLVGGGSDFCVRPIITLMTTSEKKSWEQERVKGYDRFLLRSLLRAGLPFGVLMILCKLLFAIFSHHQISPVSRLLVEFGFYVVASGGLMGIQTWQRNEKDCKKPADDDDLA